VHLSAAARLASLLLSVGAVTSAHAQTADTTRITASRLAEGIYVLMGQGGNIGLSTGPNGAFLIDDEYAPLTDRVRATVDSLCGCPVRFVLNTHWHRDHTGGNEHLGKAGVLIVAHENTRKRMSVEQFIEAFDAHVPAAPPGALPVVTFTDTITFHLNDDDIRAYHVAPAHTDGDVIIHFPRANVFHMGDTYFNGFYPFIDMGTGGTIDGMIAAADRVLAEADAGTKIIPGHGPVSGRAELAAYREMLAGIRNKVKPMVKAGRSLAQVQAARPTAKWDRAWGSAFFTPEQLVTVVFQNLGGK